MMIMITRTVTKPKYCLIVAMATNLQYQLNLKKMCYMRKWQLGNLTSLEPCPNDCKCSNILQNHNNTILPYYNVPFIWNTPLSQNECNTNTLVQQLQALAHRIMSNNNLLSLSLEKVQKNQKQLAHLDNEIHTIFDQKVEKGDAQDEEIQRYMQQTTTFSSHSTIIHKLFGGKDYRFKIKPASDLPKTIYKERNLLIPLQLVTKQGKIVKNGNLIHLCIAVCDQQGKWIVDSNDEFFIQGKIEVDLFRGECQFKKIYPKDISRHFPGGKVNIIIYPKPSILVSTLPLPQGQHLIECSQIQPLLFSNILIKAKKKYRY